MYIFFQNFKMEKIASFESYFKSLKDGQQTNEFDNKHIIDLLNELSKLDPKCKYEKLF